MPASVEILTKTQEFLRTNVSILVTLIASLGPIGASVPDMVVLLWLRVIVAGFLRRSRYDRSCAGNAPASVEIAGFVEHAEASIGEVNHTRL